MGVIEIEDPSEYALHKLLDEAGDSTEWMIRERIPYVDGPEFNEHFYEHNSEVRRYIESTVFSGQVAAEIVYMEVRGDSIDEDILDGVEEQKILGVSEETKRMILEDKPKDQDLDEYLQSKI